jgi:hypothetical protein
MDALKLYAHPKVLSTISAWGTGEKYVLITRTAPLYSTWRLPDISRIGDTYHQKKSVFSFANPD